MVRTRRWRLDCSHDTSAVTRREEMLMRLTCLLVGVTLVAGAVASSAQQQEASHKHGGSPATASVDFGVLPTAPLGPPPCLQTGAIGGPADPCSYKLHLLTPGEVTIRKGG